MTDLPGRFLTAFLDLLFPPKCVFCGKVLDDGEQGFCMDCQSALPWIGPDDPPKRCAQLSRCESPLWYRDGVRDCVHRYKFEDRPFYAGTCGKLMAQLVHDRLDGAYDLLTWAPLSRKRKKERGYDQAYLLAKAVAEELGGPPPVETLRKVRDTAAQSSLEDAQARAANVSGVYEIVDPARVAGKRVLLVDDVVTTGATLSQCAQVLLAAGAAEVLGLTFARART